jgi:hypothetical protein
MRPTNGGFMDFTITLSRDERWALLEAISNKSFKINSEIAELAELNSEWTADPILVLEDKLRQLKILAIKIEG